MPSNIPDSCFLNLPAQVTPELARAFPEKMGILFQAQLAGRSLTDLPSGRRLLVDLARTLVDCDRAALLWRTEGESHFRLQESRGFEHPEDVTVLRRQLLDDRVLGRSATLLLGANDAVDPGLAHALAGTDTASLTSVPLYAGDRVAGALVLIRRGGATFCPEEAHLVRVFAFTFESIFEDLAQAGDVETALTDRVTGLFNERYFLQQLEREIDRGRRTQEALAVALIDAAGLDGIRERHGHAVGNALLQEVARSMGHTCRKSDTLARLDDGTYAVILPRTAKHQLGQAAQRLISAVDRPFLGEVLGGTQGERVPFRVGAVVYPDDAYTPESVVDTCRSALAEAARGPGVTYYQFPEAAPLPEGEDMLDPSRMSLMRQPLVEPDQLLRLFVRLCLDTVSADRVSVMVRDGEMLVIRVAYGFAGQEEVIKNSRIPLTGQTISAWVAQKREPLLVSGAEDMVGLPMAGHGSYCNDSFLSYPLLLGDEVLGVIHFSNRSDGRPFTPDDLEKFTPVGAIMSRYLALSRGYASAQESFLQESLCELVDVSEGLIPGMEGHSKQVSQLATEMAEHMGYDADDLERIRVSSRLHDLGKVSYRSSVLSEPRGLSARERDVTQRHPLLSWKLLETVPLPRLDRDAILYHHEREDGSGYLHKPSDETPESAKILAVADVYQALISSRPYRPAVSHDKAMRYLETHRGALFAPRAVDALRSILSGDGTASA